MPTTVTGPLTFRFRGDSGAVYRMVLSAAGPLCYCPSRKRPCKHEERASEWLTEHEVTLAKPDVFARFEGRR